MSFGVSLLIQSLSYVLEKIVHFSCDGVENLFLRGGKHHFAVSHHASEDERCVCSIAKSLEGTKQQPIRVYPKCVCSLESHRLGDCTEVTLDFCLLLCDMNRIITQRLTAAAALVAQACLTLCHPMDCSPQGSSAHGESPGKNTGVGCHALLQGIFPTQGSNPGLPHCRQILYHLSHQRDWQWGRNEIVSVMRIAKTLAANLPYNKCYSPFPLVEEGPSFSLWCVSHNGQLAIAHGIGSHFGRG